MRDDRPVRVFVIVAVRLYREGIDLCLRQQPSTTVVGNAANPADAKDKILTTEPDVVLVDIDGAHGLAVVDGVRSAAPAVRIVALNVAATGPAVISCAEAGLAGCVFRDSTVADLVDTVHRAARDEVYCPPGLTARLFDRLADLADGARPAVPADHPRLTRREAEILDLIRDGRSNKEIARTLSIALPTVKNHVHSILRKLSVDRRVDAASYIPPARHPTGPLVPTR